MQRKISVSERVNHARRSTSVSLVPNCVPSTLETVPTTSWSSAMCRWEGRFDPAIRTGKHSRGDNWEATCETARESVFEGRGNVQP
jgi:hypothetical protein